MPILTKDVQTQEELFLYWLQSAHAAETRIIARMPAMIEPAGTGPLRHGRVDRLEQVFSDIGAELPTEGHAPVIDALLEEAETVMSLPMGDETTETALNAVSRLIIADERARFGTLAAWANELGRETCTTLMEASHDELRDADEMLTKAAEERKNRSA